MRKQGRFWQYNQVGIAVKSFFNIRETGNGFSTDDQLLNRNTFIKVFIGNIS